MLVLEGVTHNAVDGRNAAPADMASIPLFIDFYTSLESQVVQDFWTINSMNYTNGSRCQICKIHCTVFFVPQTIFSTVFADWNKVGWSCVLIWLAQVSWIRSDYDPRVGVQPCPGFQSPPGWQHMFLIQGSQPKPSFSTIASWEGTSTQTMPNLQIMMLPSRISCLEHLWISRDSWRT